jgi:hypothetical protein
VIERFLKRRRTIDKEVGRKQRPKKGSCTLKLWLVSLVSHREMNPDEFICRIDTNDYRRATLCKWTQRLVNGVLCDTDETKDEQLTGRGLKKMGDDFSKEHVSHLVRRTRQDKKTRGRKKAWVFEYKPRSGPNRIAQENSAFWL